MSKWRPSKECLYVVPDIHGAYGLLNKFLKRILPLRTTGGVTDRIVFLGDYIDRHSDTPKVLDTLIKIKSDYPDNAVFLAGNHELMMLNALNTGSERSAYDFWIYNGGYSTVVGYLNYAGLKEDVATLSPGRVKDLIPKDHFEFIKNLQPYYEKDSYCFVHAGFDPLKHPSEFSVDILAWDRSLLKIVQELIKKDLDLPWDKIIVCGHSSNGRGVPIVKDNYLMLDCGSPKKLLVVELYSMESFIAKPDKKRLIKYELTETVKPKTMIRRLD